MTKISDIVYENKHSWVCRDTKQNCYTVFINTITHSVSDSSYSLDDDGLSIAIARCDYMNKRKAEKALTA